MVRIICFILWGLITFVPPKAIAQTKPANSKQQRLLLNLSWGFLYVVRQNQIDRDSTLTLSSRQLNIDRLVLITQNNEVPPYANKNFVSSKQQLLFLKTQLAKYKGTQNTKLSNAIGWLYTFEQGDLQKNLDSAQLFLQKAQLQAKAQNNSKAITENLCYWGLYHYKKNELKAGDYCLQTAINQCHKNGDKFGEALALGYKAVYYPFGLCPFALRICYLKRALVLYQQLNDKENQALTLINTAYFLFANNELAEAKKMVLQSMAVQKEIGFAYTHYTTDLLALLSAVEGNHGDFLKYALQSIRSVEAINDNIGRAYFYARAGDAYNVMDNKANESVAWYLKALSQFKKTGGDLAMYKLLVNLSTQMAILGRSKEVIVLAKNLIKQYPPVNAMDKQNLFMVLGGAYYSIGQKNITAKYYQQALQLQAEVQAISGNVNTGYIYFTIGFYYLNTKQYEKSRGYFNKILSTKSQSGVGLNEMNAINLALFTIDSAAGNYPNAIKHLKAYNRLNDFIYSEKQSKQIQEWDIFYNTEKKEKNLQLLTKDNQVKELGLKKAAFTRNIIIASAVLLLALLFTGYWFKQRHNKKLQFQQKEINAQNQLLKQFLAAEQKLVEEKEWLVKEIHHRVKNNLQMIISLLNAQSEFLDHPSALNAIKESRERMQAIALIHQKLYQPQQGTFINMACYIPELVNYLSSCFVDAGLISFNLDIEDINLDVSQAVPLGLILNEAITNAVKYAFPLHKSGKINILFRHSDDENLTLKISDNGQGFPDSFDFANNNSLGLQLIQLFAEQLEAKLEFKNAAGVEIVLNFKQFISEKTKHLS
jgi:two-component system, sensor histidine kinase PdtaS